MLSEGRGYNLPTATVIRQSSHYTDGLCMAAGPLDRGGCFRGVSIWRVLPSMPRISRVTFAFAITCIISLYLLTTIASFFKGTTACIAFVKIVKIHKWP